MPDLIADVSLYRTEDGGRKGPTPSDFFGCPCLVSQERPVKGYDARLLLGGRPMSPGERRQAGMKFLTPEGAEAIRSAGKFYLWERGIIGEGQVVADRKPS